MKRILITFIVTLLITISIKAQHQELSEKPDMYKGKKSQSVDTTSLLYAFKSGHFNGHFRYFFMNTQNQNELTDYYAHAAGGGIRYETARFHGFQFAVSGSYVFNIASSDLAKADSITGQFNRYEIALFDVEDPRNKKDLDRMEELFLKYNYKNSSIILGRQFINTPFINLQDGRMRTTVVEGLWLEFNQLKNTKIEAGWIYAFSPRGTTQWYDAGESIGVYSSGVNVDGTKSQYNNNIESNGVAVLGITRSVNNKFKLQVWDIYTEHVFNTIMLQTDAQFPLKNNQSIFASAQIIRQDALNNGGNKDAAKTYFEKNGKAISYGARAGWKDKKWEVSINYNRITSHGRYLMPREWGREPFFTFLPRERNEGFGDVHAFMTKINYNIPKAKIKASLATGYYKLPDVKNYRLNKYGVPSYTQANADVRYSFGGLFTGLEAQLLIVAKLKNGETYQNDKFVFNKVNMIQYNFVLNFHF